MKKALLVIDVQNEYFSGKLPVSYPQDSIDNILKVIDSAHKAGIFTIFVQHFSSATNAKAFVKESDEWELHPEIKKRKCQALIEKNYPGSFTGTNLDEILKGKGIDTVVICGYMTQTCCDTTSRQAFHLFYNVEFLSDATGTLDIDNYAGSVKAETLHNTILVIQASRFSRVLTTEEWINDIAKC
ncbi:MAG: cysteine hydrolase family protein [Candidatus Kapabacteria bacterium]|nr:cysteine hydrolase family protein [Candidatus Kapabacteria bacterium]